MGEATLEYCRNCGKETPHIFVGHPREIGVAWFEHRCLICGFGWVDKDDGGFELEPDAKP